MLKRRATPVIAALLIIPATIAQPAPPQGKPLTFDAASVKRAASETGPVIMRKGGPGPARSSGGPGTSDPGRIHYSGTSLMNLLSNAYEVKLFQVVGPGWLTSESFDVDATMPPTTTKEQFRVMLQNLLIERFKLAIHRETRELPIYALVKGKNGAKLKESKGPYDEGPLKRPDSPPKPGPDGFPLAMPELAGHRGIFVSGRATGDNGRRIVFQQQSTQDLADRLTDVLRRPVKNDTSLTANYDFTLTFADDDGLFGPARGTPAANTEPLPDLFTAIQVQLGLKLEPKTGPVEVLVVDHAEKIPTEN